MKNVFFMLVFLFFATTKSSFISNIRDGAFSFLQRPVNSENRTRFIPYTINKHESHVQDVKYAKRKAEILQKLRINQIKNRNHDPKIESEKYVGGKKKERYIQDPVLNNLRRRNSNEGSNESDAFSSSLEMKDWKEEWRNIWEQKKIEALNATTPRGDYVNMVGARPWGVPCGDPNQHDMPWGTCMLSQECEAEYRIFRGDNSCGRTRFVCCAIMSHTYDMYHGFDVSFGDDDLKTDTEEVRNRIEDSKDSKSKKKNQDKRKRAKDRKKRKKKINKKITKIISEMKKLLRKTLRNRTKIIKRKTQQLKKFIKLLKKQFKRDRESIRDIHSQEFERVDNELLAKLWQIKKTNKDFILNDTFRFILINGTMNRKQALLLLRTYPDLAGYIDARRMDGLEVEDAVSAESHDDEYGFVYH